MGVETLVVLDRLASLPRRWLEVPTCGSALVVSLTPHEEHLEGLVAHVQRAADRVEVVHGAGHLDGVAEELRPEYARLVAAAAEKIEVGGRRLRQAFTFEGRLSLWWLNELFGKRSDLYPGFTRLCQLEWLRSLIEREGPRLLLLLTEDPAFWGVVRDLCRAQERSFGGGRPAPWRAWMRRSALPRVLLSSLVWFGRAAVQTLLARPLADFRASAELPEAPLCAFHTIYPLLWRGGRADADERYGATPRLLARRGRFGAIYACSFSSDGKHQHVTVRQFARLCRWLKARRAEGGRVPIALIDGYARWRDLLAAARQLRLVVRYSALERSRSYRDHWVLRGMGFHSLLREELRAAMVRTPRYLLHGLRVRRFVEAVRPRALVYYHFEFGLGRAIAFGSLTGHPATALVGAQDGVVARLKLWSTNVEGELRFGAADRLDLLSSPPLPDLVLLEGRAARERFLEAGYPDDRLRVVGAPRVDRLCGLPRWSPRGAVTDRFTVLVALGGNDADSLLAALRPALGLGPRFHFLLKLHPRSGPSKGEVERWSAATTAAPRASCSVEAGDVYRLLPTADVVLATYSSFAIEAAARGYPLICLALSDRITASPLREIDAPNVQVVTTSGQLAEALARLAAARVVGQGPHEPDLGEVFFHRLDGSSSERWALAIEGFLVEARPAQGSAVGPSDRA